MSVRPPADCENMEQVRAEIDRLDLAILDLVADASAMSTAPGSSRRGARKRRAVAHPQVIDRVRARAQESGVPPELAEALWRQMIGWFIQYEEEKLSKAARPAGVAEADRSETGRPNTSSPRKRGSSTPRVNSGITGSPPARG